MLLLETIDSKPGAKIDISNGTDAYFKINGTAYITDEEEWNYLLKDYLSKKLDYIEFFHHGRNLGDKIINDFKITPTGWKYIEKSKSINQDSNTAFIAMWFSPETNEIKESILNAVKLAGYDPKIVNAEPFNGDIVDQIITLVNRAKFVVADLTGQRQGVYFEAGYAKGLNIPVIYTVRDDQIDPQPTEGNPDPQKVHFDLNHQNIITWNNDSLNDFKEKLRDRITATIGDGPLISND